MKKMESMAKRFGTDVTLKFDWARRDWTAEAHLDVENGRVTVEAIGDDAASVMKKLETMLTRLDKENQ